MLGVGKWNIFFFWVPHPILDLSRFAFPLDGGMEREILPEFPCLPESPLPFCFWRGEGVMEWPILGGTKWNRDSGTEGEAGLPQRE